MDDNELLELAAKAAGVKLRPFRVKPANGETDGFIGYMTGPEWARGGSTPSPTRRRTAPSRMRAFAAPGIAMSSSRSSMTHTKPCAARSFVPPRCWRERSE